MEVIDIADAEMHFEKLIDEVEQGKSFVIRQHGVALVRLVPVQNLSEQCQPIKRG